MKHTMARFAFGILVFISPLFLFQLASGTDTKTSGPDKALCDKMIRLGQQSYQRGKYLDAKEYFRKAVQADPNSSAAWRQYDIAVVSALAEKVEKEEGLTAPGVSDRKEAAPAGRPETAPSTSVQPPPPPATPAPAKKERPPVKDEGC
jgi:tetratricopeptide (TPR) repeat protein